MKIYKVGDKSKAICHICKAIKETTFKLRDVPFSDGAGVVKDVMVGVCNTCDTVVSMPSQSTPKVQRVIEEKRKSVEARVPAHMIDILNAASYELCGSIEFVPELIKYYIVKLSSKDKIFTTKSLSRYLKSDLAQGKQLKRVSLKGRRIAEDINILKVLTQIPSTTGIIKSVVLKINNDVLNKKNKTIIRQLKDVAASSV